MPRRKVQRTLEEEEEFRKRRRERNTENQRRRRMNKNICDNANKHYEIREAFDNEGTSTTVTAVIQVNSNECNLDNSMNSLIPRPANHERIRGWRAQQRGFRNLETSLYLMDLNDIEEHYTGEMNVSCVNCGAKHFANERVSNKGNSFHDCCAHGQVVLEPLPEPPGLLRALFDGSHAKSNIFYERIRSYNSCVSFASFNANLVNFRGRRPGPYCFKIQGQIYYQINTALYPAPNDIPSYGQLFIIDANEAMEYRLSQNLELDRDILYIIDHVIRENNIFVHSYQMMGEEIRDQQELARQNNEVLPELKLLFTLKAGLDRRRYNFQRVNEVAAVFSTTADGEIPESYVTIRNKNTKNLQKISTMDPNVEPWIYPLFYPYGTRGWHRNLMRVDGNREKRISRAAYVKYRMAIRSGINVFLMGRRLFQQWVVDSYVKIEKDRIDYCKTHQTKIRTETYQGLIDYLENTARNMNTRIGKMIVLPSTFVGSPRNMMQHYQDAMAIVRKYGKPDLFITMTCNPKWKEIEENLLHGQQPADRPDICARVFNIKKDFLIDLIIRQKCFGEVLAYVYVIEFQKRGLPHIHMLVTLKEYSKIITPEIVDKYISAEIPDPNENRKLHDIVMKHMIHGPCADWCLVNGKCSKHYPKRLQEETVIDEGGYPYYRRRSTRNSFERPGGYTVDNRYVVPYCPRLLLYFNSHINVEIVSSVKSVKYLYKYIYKGHDAAAISISQFSNDNVVNHDEIRDYIEARYVGPVEACWRILSKPLQEKSHTIIRLPVHLPNEHNITINEGSSETTLRNALNQVTMLLDYFALNSRDESAKQYLYAEIPCHYVFKKNQTLNVCQWERRKAQFNCIGRMYSISPTQTELFYLRLLLLNIKGATSFEDLRTVNGEIQQTFSATCLALGLIEDDEEWKRAMHEAEVWMMPTRLRRLFVRILIHCQPVHPEGLWHEFKEAMSEDYTRHFGLLQGQRKAYAQINAMLHAEGWSLEQFPSMEQSVQLDATEESILPQEAMETGMQQYVKLNEKQRKIVDAVLNVVDNNEYGNNTCFYIDGPGGSGKTFTYNTLWYLLKGRNKCVSTMAFTGIAATLLPHGKTIHKTLGLPVPLYADSSSNIKIQSKEGAFLKKIDVFIWDEAPMAPRYAMEIMDRLLRDIMNNNLPFGGKIVVLGGDFRQLLPIKVRGTRSEIVNLSIKNSNLWLHFKKFNLTQNMRALSEEIEFAEFLLNIGNGVLNDPDDNIIIPERCVAHINANIVEDVFGTLLKEKRYKEITSCAILSARNIDVDEINIQIVELLDPKEERIYTSIDTTENCDNGDIAEVLLPEYLHSLNPPNFPPHELKLRINTIIMLVRNLSVNEGLCNGTRLRVLKLSNHLLQCEILTGDKTGEIVFLNRITLYCENIYPFVFKRRQFPIRLAFAMTINKSQGQTFDKIGLDLRKDVFNHGQLYVAFSRVRSWEAIRVYLGDQKNNNTVKNPVYKELYE